MDEIRLSGRMAVDPKDYDDLVEICEALADDARGHPGVIEYSFWANGKRDTIHFREHYESAAALLGHLERLDGPTIKRLLELARPEPTECAAADSEATRQAIETLAALGAVIEIYTPVARS